MRILALETSTDRLSIALHIDGQTRAREVDAGQQHSDLALPLVRELLDEAGVTVKGLDAIAFGQGPGSFTGVRIACGLAQGMAYGAGLGLIPVESQMTLAEQGNCERTLVALDARMGEIYLAAYVRDESRDCGWTPEIAPRLAQTAGLPDVSGNGWQVTGSALRQPALLAALQNAYHSRAATWNAEGMPSAAGAATLAARMLARGGTRVLVHPRDAAPLYLRDRVALTLAERAKAKEAA